jgi:hypothetical protein
MNTVEGFIIDRNKNKLRFLYGRWNEFLCSADPEVVHSYNYVPSIPLGVLVECSLELLKEHLVPTHNFSYII